MHEHAILVVGMERDRDHESASAAHRVYSQIIDMPRLPCCTIFTSRRLHRDNKPALYKGLKNPSEAFKHWRMVCSCASSSSLKRCSHANTISNLKTRYWRREPLPPHNRETHDALKRHESETQNPKTTQGNNKDHKPYCEA